MALSMKAQIKVKNEASEVQLVQRREVGGKTQIKRFIKGITKSMEPIP